MTKEERRQHCERYESRVSHLYLDSVGKPTIGVGCLVHMPFQPEQYGIWVVDGETQASPKAVADDYERIMVYSARQQAAAPKDKYVADYFARFCRTRLTDPSIDRLLDQRIDGIIAEIRVAFPTYDTSPEPAKDGLFDMCFNAGVAGIRSWKNFAPAFDRADWPTCVAECLREGAAWKERNDWTQAKFREAMNA